jgi:biotin transport system ATP-binding protein
LTIAGILAMRPRVIVFDEPFSSLDLFGVQQVLRQILALKETGHTLLVTTHDLDKIIAHTDRLLLLHEGRLVQEGHPNEILPVVENYGVREPDVSRLGMNVRSWLN